MMLALTSPQTRLMLIMLVFWRGLVASTLLYWGWRGSARTDAGRTPDGRRTDAGRTQGRTQDGRPQKWVSASGSKRRLSYADASGAGRRKTPLGRQKPPCGRFCHSTESRNASRAKNGRWLLVVYNTRKIVTEAHCTNVWATNA